MSQGQAALNVVALWLGLTGMVVAAPTWDTGITMDGELEDKEIVLPISLESPSTDTLECEPEESDHWVDPEESIPLDEGDDPDAYANWESTKCWWWAEGGDPTQGSWTTTWTAPETQGGIFRLECSIEDLPKACNKGTRDDARAYAGTGYAGGGGAAPPPARAYSAVLQKLHSEAGVDVVGPAWLRHSEGHGDRRMNDMARLPSADGYFKKIEWVATINPTEPPVRAPAYFEWVQKVKGESVLDGTPDLGPFYSWADDSPGTAFRTNTMDEDGKVYMIDGPGFYTGGLYVPAGEHYWRMNLAGDPSQAVRFYNKLKFQGKRISTNYGNDDGQDWSRYLRIWKPAGGPWQVLDGADD